MANGITYGIDPTVKAKLQALASGLGKGNVAASVSHGVSAAPAPKQTFNIEQ